MSESEEPCPTLVSVHDRLEVVNTLARYAHCYDESDWGGLAGLFHPDATFVVHGTVIDGVPETLAGRDAIVAALRGRRERTAASIRRHAVSTVDVVDQSVARMRVRSYLLTSSVDAGELNLVVSGRYEDVLESDEERCWRFRARTVRLDAVVHQRPDAPTSDG